jgi:hypothetical protein
VSKYTTELRYLIENDFDIGLKNYPIFDENYRELLNQKIINHYYFREIGMETAELFKRYLNTTMNEIMPYYNQLYKSELLEFNPFYNVDKTIVSDKNNNSVSDFIGNTTGKNQQKADTENTQTNNGKQQTTTAVTSVGESVGNSKGSGKTTNKSKRVSSDTPQGFLSINSIDSETYASAAEMANGETVNEFTVNDTKATSSNSENGTTDQTNVAETKAKGNTTSNATTETDTANKTTSNDFENYVSHVIGKSEGETYSEMLLKFRDTFLNIDMMIIDELKTCFMMIY